MDKAVEEVASLLELPQTLEVYDQSPYRVCDILSPALYLG